MLQTSHATAHNEIGLQQMLRRIQGEFLEMPGLRLTCRQAQRLWNLDALICESLLAALVDAHFLVQTADGLFIQSTGPSIRRVHGQ